MDVVTHDMAQMGWRERKMAEELLHAWNENGLPDDFTDNEITIAFNSNSGCVFLTNSEYQAAMMNGNNLESWYRCPECGHEGFKENMREGKHGERKACLEYLKDICA